MNFFHRVRLIAHQKALVTLGIRIGSVHHKRWCLNIWFSVGGAVVEEVKGSSLAGGRKHIP